MVFKTEKSHFYLIGSFIKEVRTSEGWDNNVQEWHMKYEYQIESRNEQDGKLYKINFSSIDGLIIPRWIDYQFNLSKINSLGADIWNHVSVLTNEADKNILENCLKLKEQLLKDTFFGIHVLQLGSLINDTSSYIQILDFYEYEDNKIVYYKGGVWTDKEQDIKISDYRHLLEWNPLDKQIKLLKLEIVPGQKFAANSHVLFNLSYDPVNPIVQFNTKSKPDSKTVSKWIEYISQVIKDSAVIKVISNLLI